VDTNPNLKAHEGRTSQDFSVVVPYFHLDLQSVGQMVTVNEITAPTVVWRLHSYL
jgi:hypothetical protein